MAGFFGAAVIPLVVAVRRLGGAQDDYWGFLQAAQDPDATVRHRGTVIDASAYGVCEQSVASDRVMELKANS
jgi:hypothetical protein